MILVIAEGFSGAISLTFGFGNRHRNPVYGDYDFHPMVTSGFLLGFFSVGQMSYYYCKETVRGSVRENLGGTGVGVPMRCDGDGTRKPQAYLMLHRKITHYHV